MNETTVTKHLLGFEITKVTNHDLREMYKKADFDERTYDIIPRFVINESGYIEYRDDFIDEKIADDKLNTTYYHLIKFIPIDEWLVAEYDNDGLDDVLKNINFNELIYNLKISKPENIKQMNYLVIRTTTYASYDHWNGGYEYDTENSVLGYLDNDFEMIKIENK